MLCSSSSEIVPHKITLNGINRHVRVIDKMLLTQMIDKISLGPRWDRAAVYLQCFIFTRAGMRERLRVNSNTHKLLNSDSLMGRCCVQWQKFPMSFDVIDAARQLAASRSLYYFYIRGSNYAVSAVSLCVASWIHSVHGWHTSVYIADTTRSRAPLLTDITCFTNRDITESHLLKLNTTCVRLVYWLHW